MPAFERHQTVSALEKLSRGVKPVTTSRRCSATEKNGYSSKRLDVRISSGTHSGLILRKMRPVRELTATWVKEDFAKCGLKLDRFSDLPNRFVKE